MQRVASTANSRVPGRSGPMAPEIRRPPAVVSQTVLSTADATAIRTAIRDQLALPGAPQMLLQLGLAHTAPATARRPASDLIEP